MVILYGVLTGLNKGAFSYCSALTSITIPDSVKFIGGAAFERCYKLASITIGSGVTTIGYFAFNECSELIQVENGVSYVDKWVINCDKSITSVTLRQNTVGIAYNAFNNCTGLKSITLSDSMKIIDEHAFV